MAEDGRRGVGPGGADGLSRGELGRLTSDNLNRSDKTTPFAILAISLQSWEDPIENLRAKARGERSP
jgi:hypothetical protein